MEFYRKGCQKKTQQTPLMRVWANVLIRGLGLLTCHVILERWLYARDQSKMAVSFKELSIFFV